MIMDIKLVTTTNTKQFTRIKYTKLLNPYCLEDRIITKKKNIIRRNWVPVLQTDARQHVESGTHVDLGGRRIIKKKKK